MPTGLIDILFALITVGVGIAGGWWLRSRSTSPRNLESEINDVRRAHEILVGLRSLATHVAKEVGEHSSRVEEINGELMSTNLQEPARILNAVSRIIDVNRTMQDRLEDAEDRLREQARLVASHAAEARTDPLTRVGNRRALDSEMARLVAEFIRNGRPFALVMVDLDHFKRFNDTRGHQAGDEVLRGVGRLLERVVRDTDIVTRYGGEEFAVLLPSCSDEEARRIAAKIRQTIEKANFRFDGNEFHITASLGAAMIVADEDGPALTKRTDTSLYVSKQEGRNCVHWHDGVESIRLEADGGLPRSEPPPVPQSLPQEDPAEPREAAPCELRPELLNRTVFCQHVRARVAEWRRGGPALSLVMMELDDGRMAASDGPAARDAKLAILARHVLAIVRQMDLVAEYGPTCVAFLLPGALLADAVNVAERIRQSILTHPGVADDGPMHFSVSAGVIEVADHDDLVSLFRRTEAALDASHTRGGNCTCYHDGDRCLPVATLLEPMGDFRAY